MGLFARHVDRLPPHFHIAATAASKLPATGGWLPVLVVAAAVFVLGMWWVSKRA